MLVDAGVHEGAARLHAEREVAAPAGDGAAPEDCRTRGDVVRDRQEVQ